LTFKQRVGASSSHEGADKRGGSQGSWDCIGSGPYEEGRGQGAARCNKTVVLLGAKARRAQKGEKLKVSLGNNLRISRLNGAAGRKGLGSM